MPECQHCGRPTYPDQGRFCGPCQAERQQGPHSWSHRVASPELGPDPYPLVESTPDVHTREWLSDGLLVAAYLGMLLLLGWLLGDEVPR